MSFSKNSKFGRYNSRGCTFIDFSRVKYVHLCAGGYKRAPFRGVMLYGGLTAAYSASLLCKPGSEHSERSSLRKFSLILLLFPKRSIRPTTFMLPKNKTYRAAAKLPGIAAWISSRMQRALWKLFFRSSNLRHGWSCGLWITGRQRIGIFPVGGRCPASRG